MRSATKTKVLEIKGLCVDYGLGRNAVHAVLDVNLTLNRGEVLGLVGESGSGKSTLAYALTRLLPPPGVVSWLNAWSPGWVVFGPGSSLQQATTDCAVLASASTGFPVLSSMPSPLSPAYWKSAIESVYFLYGGNASS